jgi:hypothetical protein
MDVSRHRGGRAHRWHASVAIAIRGAGATPTRPILAGGADLWKDWWVGSSQHGRLDLPALTFLYEQQREATCGREKVWCRMLPARFVIVRTPGEFPGRRERSDVKV